MKTDSIIINSNTAAIGVDLGGTKTETILLASNGHVLWRQRRPTNRSDGYNAILSKVAEMINEAAAQLPLGTNYTVGIGIPGSLDVTTNLVRNANSTCLIGRTLQSDIEQLIKRPVQIRNDADCFIDELYSEGIEKVKKYAFHEKLRTPILKNQLGDSAGVFGAAWIGQTVTGRQKR
jgi:predicted NBD/HSP70 family sugar kinase